MVQAENAAAADAESSWRDRALERSLEGARARAMSRSDRFIATAIEILQESGRSDFTIQELVDRSRTSLRSFYQYFAGKDELLLALLEETIAKSVAEYRTEIEGKDALAALQVVIRKFYGTSSGHGDALVGINRALASYHVTLASGHAADYRRALSPLTKLVAELMEQGVKEGVIRSDIKPRTLISTLLQMVVGSTMMNALGSDRVSDKSAADAVWAIAKAGIAA